VAVMFCGEVFAQLSIGISTVAIAAINRMDWILLPKEIRFIFSSFQIKN
jgi:hypothetical protein